MQRIDASQQKIEEILDLNLSPQQSEKQDKSGLLIKNIIVIGGVKGNNGERNKNPLIFIDEHPIIGNNEPNPNDVANIISQIKSLLEVAKEHHNIKRMTQVVTDELSFYTGSAPLSFNGYITIIKETYNELKELPPNIILTISSMPVIWPDGTMRNAGLQAQSPNTLGSPPLLYHFSKEYVSNLDPYYAKTTLLQATANLQNCYEICPDNYDSKYSPNIVLAESGVCCSSNDQYKSAIVVRGLNIPAFINVIDMCTDHLKGVGRKNLEKLLIQLNKSPEQKEIPIYVTHTITSNSVEADDWSLVASPIHADWIDRKSGDVTLKKEKVGPSHFGTSILYIYHQMRAELLTLDQFTLAAQQRLNIFKTHVTELIDNHGNSLLHHVFLLNKTSTGSLNRFREIGKINKILSYFWNEAINRQNNNGDTPLHLAITVTDNKNILMKLIEHGARLDIVNKQGKTPIQLAYENNKKELIEWLLSQLKIIEDLTATTTFLETYLLHAYSTENATILNSLVANSSPSQVMTLLATIEKIMHTDKSQDELAKWLCQTLLKNELERAQNKNLDVFTFTLSHYPMLNLNDRLSLSFFTLAEHIFITAYLIRSPALLNQITIVLDYVNIDIHTILTRIKKILSADDPTITWLNHTLIQNEAYYRRKLGRIDTIIEALTPTINYRADSGFDNLCIGSFLIYLAIMQKNSLLLDKIQLAIPTIFANNNLVNSAILKFYEPKIQLAWLYQTVVKNEFKHGQQANSKLIMMALAHCNFAEPSGMNELTLGKYLLIQAYISNNIHLLTTHQLHNFCSQPDLLKKISTHLNNPTNFLNWFDSHTATTTQQSRSAVNLMPSASANLYFNNKKIARNDRTQTESENEAKKMKNL